MALRRSTKLLIWSIVAMIAIGFGWVAHGFTTTFHRFFTEEKICGTYQPLIMALYDLKSDSGCAATNLIQLVPQYLPKIPSSPVADSVTYQILPDGTNWQLSVHSHALKPARVYVHRSGGNFTKDEERQRLTAFHEWVVFREE